MIEPSPRKYGFPAEQLSRASDYFQTPLAEYLGPTENLLCPGSSSSLAVLPQSRDGYQRADSRRAERQLLLHIAGGVLRPRGRGPPGPGALLLEGGDAGAQRRHQPGRLPEQARGHRPGELHRRPGADGADHVSQRRPGQFPAAATEPHPGKPRQRGEVEGQPLNVRFVAATAESVPSGQWMLRSCHVRFFERIVLTQTGWCTSSARLNVIKEC